MQCRFSKHFCTLFTFFFIHSSVYGNIIPTIVIEPSKLHCNEKLYHGNSVNYHLTNLEGNTGYELRISYPAVIPTEFIIKELNTTASTGRKLLNIEKLIFWTKTEEKEKVIQVTAFRTGFPVKSSLKAQPVTYNIILERLHGGLPLNIWKVIFIILVTITIVVKCCLKPVINLINDVQKLE